MTQAFVDPLFAHPAILHFAQRGGIVAGGLAWFGPVSGSIPGGCILLYATLPAHVPKTNTVQRLTMHVQVVASSPL